MSLKRILIILLFLYVFYSDILISFTGIPVIKNILALLFVLVFSVDFVLYAKTYHNKQFLIVPIFLMIFFILIWQQMGLISFFYVVIFGWILTQDSNYSLKLIRLTFWIQFILVLYEFSTRSVIYTYVESGIFTQHVFNYGNSMQLFASSGFRPKGLFPGTLVATSFIIYLAMIYRNNIKMLVFVFLMAVMVNGRLALIVLFFTLGFKLFKQYDIVMYYKKFRKRFSITLQLFFWGGVLLLAILFIFSVLPAIQVQNILNSVNFKSTSNAGRIYRYGQAFMTFIHYNIIQILFGFPDYKIYDVYGRIVAAESGLLSMLLSIGLLGTFYYFYYFFKSWRSDNKPVLDLNNKTIGFKYVIIITILSFMEYNHLGGNVRGVLFWFIIIDQLKNSQSLKGSFFDKIKILTVKNQ